MNTAHIKEQAVRFSRARNNLLLVVAITVINLVLILMETDVSFLFSATMPSILLYVDWGFLEFVNNLGEPLSMARIVVAFGITSIYLFCWIFAKKVRVLIVVAFVLFAADALLFIGVIAYYGVEFDFSLAIQVGFLLWIMYYLVMGMIAWVNLRNTSSKDVEAAQQEVSQEALNAEANTALNELSIQDDSSNNDESNSSNETSDIDEPFES